MKPPSKLVRSSHRITYKYKHWHSQQPASPLRATWALLPFYASVVVDVTVPSAWLVVVTNFPLSTTVVVVVNPTKTEPKLAAIHANYATNEGEKKVGNE